MMPLKTNISEAPFTSLGSKGKFFNNYLRSSAICGMGGIIGVQKREIKERKERTEVMQREKERGKKKGQKTDIKRKTVTLSGFLTICFMK